MKIQIAGNKIDAQSPTFIIAELSANHNQDFDLAVKTIKAMKESGANAVKVQTYTADTITLDSKNKYFTINQGTIWDGKNLHQLYKEAYTPWEWQPKLKKVAEEIGLVFFSSPFDKTAVDFLGEMNVPAYKIASFEITDVNLIEYVAKKGKPVIISTGIATFDDITEAIETCKIAGNNQVAILKCSSAYPAPLQEMNLRTIPDMAKRFKAVVGLSDHTMSLAVPIAAITLGARIIEKHFILDRSIGGPDASFSLNPKEFKSMVNAVRDTEKALGQVNYELTANTKRNREHSRSLFAIEDIAAGEEITEKNIRSIRPGFGLHPRLLKEILGRKASANIKKGTPLSMNLIEKAVLD